MSRPDRAWAADLTYVRLARGFVYVPILMDLFNCKVIGWALSNTLQAKLAVDALLSTLTERTVQAGIIHHSDRGIQYARADYTQILKAHGFTISMSRKGNPYDDARLASFMRTLKCEKVYLNEYETEHATRRTIARFREDIDNHKRLHSSLGYRSPDTFEDEFSSQQAAELPVPFSGVSPIPGHPYSPETYHFWHFHALLSGFEAAIQTVSECRSDPANPCVGTIRNFFGNEMFP